MTKSQIHSQLNHKQLTKAALANKEGSLDNNKVFVATTGMRTGRSPKDKFIVCDDNTQNSIKWGKVNQPMTTENFAKLYRKSTEYRDQLPQVYQGEYFVGQDPNHAIKVAVTTEYAWHQMFALNMFVTDIGPEPSEIATWEILSLPRLNLDPNVDHTNSDSAVIINFTTKQVLLCGLRYAGELKKSMFTVLNYILPSKDILPMHCAASINKNNKSCLFFGLSGTGKTTLSADPENSTLIGDDEHGWSDQGIFNFEGGCYAKCIDLSPEREPLIWDAIRPGAILENVYLDENKQPNYRDSRYTSNTRASYPLDFIENRVKDAISPHPSAVVLLTCDLYGVLPPIAALNHNQAAYYFLSGYTALVGSTEVGGSNEIKPVFSTCFGAPFFPRPAVAYAKLLLKRLSETNAQVYLVNTGWHGGGYGVGDRFSIATSRELVRQASCGEILNNPTNSLPGFNLTIPVTLDNIDPELLDPRLTWRDNNILYSAASLKLRHQFIDNFKRFNVAKEILGSGPNLVAINEP